MKLYWQNISWYWAVSISHINMSWCFQWRITSTERDIYRHAIIKQYHSFHTIFKLHYWGGWGLGGVGRDCSWGETLGLGGIWSDLYKIEAYALSKILGMRQIMSMVIKYWIQYTCTVSVLDYFVFIHSSPSFNK